MVCSYIQVTSGHTCRLPIPQPPFLRPVLLHRSRKVRPLLTNAFTSTSVLQLPPAVCASGGRAPAGLSVAEGAEVVTWLKEIEELLEVDPYHDRLLLRRCGCLWHSQVAGAGWQRRG